MALACWIASLRVLGHVVGVPEAVPAFGVGDERVRSAGERLEVGQRGTFVAHRPSRRAGRCTRGGRSLLAVSEDLWEAHAGWWQDGFTDGADPEYEEQILPLAPSDLAGLPAGARRRVRRGPGRPAGGRRGRRGRRDRPDVGPGPGRARAGRRSVVRRRVRPICPSPTPVRCRVACLVFEHIREVDAAIREVVARVLEPGGRFLFFLNHPLLQTPDSGWIDDQFARPARAVLARSAPTSSRTRRSRRWRRACSSRSSTGRCAYLNTSGPRAGCMSSGWRSPPRRPASCARARPSTSRRSRASSACRSSARRQADRTIQGCRSRRAASVAARTVA